MKTFMCIGNGPSRKNVNLSMLKIHTKNHITIGCNYVYKKFPCDYVALWDEEVLKRVVKEVYFTKLIVPDPVDRNIMGISNTGYFSIWWAINKAKATEIHLVGFDHLSNSDSGETLTDSIIKENYGYSTRCTQTPNNRSYRGDRIAELIKNNPKVNFVIWYPTKRKGISTLSDCPNATIKAIPKMSKLNKMMKSINEALMVA